MHWCQCNVRDFPFLVVIFLSLIMFFPIYGYLRNCNGFATIESRISAFGQNESVWVTVIFVPLKHAISKTVFIYKEQFTVLWAIRKFEILSSCTSQVRILVLS